MKYYHATTEKTMEKIFTDGAIRKSWDGCVYLCTTAVDACKFLILRGIKRMIVVEVELDESEVEESHDHNEHFFQCKAYIHHSDIEVTGAEPTWEYTFDF